MDDLLTTKQVMDLLQVNRITVYRMLNDGRLKGVKIGQQWRFARYEVESLLGGGVHTQPASSSQQFPVHCLQVVQDVCANLAQVGAFMVDMQGDPLTEFSNPSRLCSLLHNTRSGLKACQEYYKDVIESPELWGEWTTCHAGLSLIANKISQDGEQVGLLLAGQCCLHPLDDVERQENLRRLETLYKLDPDQVTDLIQNASNFSTAEIDRVKAFPEQVIKAVESILNERAKLAQRLQHIAEISTL